MGASSRYDAPMFISRYTISLVAIALSACFSAAGSEDDVGESTTDDSTSAESTSESTSVDTESAEVGGGCGDDLIAIDEECDGENLGNATCESLGYFGGTLACTDTCKLDVSGCQMESICGNGIAEGDEVCDGGDFAGETCETVGDFIDGALMCSDTCDEIITLACLSPGEGGMCGADEDCPPEAPACTNGACWNGSETDPCDFGGDCGANSCVNGQCWDGSEGDPCNANDYCSETAPFCNPVDMKCHDGSEGDPCSINAECSDSSPYCVDMTCWDGGLGDPCINNGNCDPTGGAPFCSDLTDTCQTGEPGSPCAVNGDCISNACDLALMICQ